jgi:transglutaminase-like putative cysteine protease
LSARYVSGYLETLPPPGKPRLVGADASHAWAQACIPDYGWLDLDPTNGVIPSGRHVTLAYGRDFSDVSPLRGVVLGGGSHRLSVSVDVEAIA